MVIIPEYLLQRRRYPVQVYLYAINEYCKDEDKSQRKIAKEVIKMFGLTTFAHTTLGRVLKKLGAVIKNIREPWPNNEGIGVGEIKGEDAASQDGSLAGRRKRINIFINKWLPQYEQNRSGIETAFHAMARRVWLFYQVLLI